MTEWTSTPVGEALHLLGGSLPIDGRLSWRGPDDIGLHEQMNCYVLRHGTDAIMVETGVPLFHPEIAAGLRRQPDLPARLRLAVTRIEPDSLSNIRNLTRDFGVGHIFAPGALDPLDFFEDLSSQALMDSYQLDCNLLRDGDIIDFGTSRLEVIAPPLRTLATQWLYDPVAGILFCSDSFSHFAAYAPGDRVVTRGTEARFHADPQRHLLTKFDWLARAERPQLIAALRAIFAQRRVTVLAPTRGAVIHGEDLVGQQVDEMIAALETM